MEGSYGLFLARSDVQELPPALRLLKNKTV